MSTIDAAIIKALVEHIGSGSSSSIIEVPWSAKELNGHNVVAFTPPAGLELKKLTQLRVAEIANPENIHTYYLTDMVEHDGKPVYLFKTFSSTVKTAVDSTFQVDEGVYSTDFPTDEIAVPDNIKTGFFVGDSLSGLAGAIVDIIDTITST